MGEYSMYKRRVFGTRSPIASIRKPLSAFITACRCPTFWSFQPAREVEPLDLTVPRASGKISTPDYLEFSITVWLCRERALR